MGCKANAAPQSLRLKFSDYSEIDPRGSMALDDHQCSILPSHMFAFILNDRAYGKKSAILVIRDVQADEM